jgi:hypothetical protein
MINGVTIPRMLNARTMIEAEMANPHLAKATELRDLAMEFREKADELRLIGHIALMLRSAEDLERVADELERMSDESYIMSPVAGHA